MGINISGFFFFLLLVRCLFLEWGELWTWPVAPAASLGILVFVGPASSCLPLLFPSPHLGLSGLEGTRLHAGKGLVSEEGGEERPRFVASILKDVGERALRWAPCPTSATGCAYVGEGTGTCHCLLVS